MDKKQQGYFLYARKSTEDGSRQIQSIPDQVREMKLFAQRRGLEITEIFTESKSAKDPDQRPAFTEMIKKLNKGKAFGVLAWKTDRLSRNLPEAVQLQHILQTEKIQTIITPQIEFKPDDNILPWCLTIGQDCQYSRGLSRNVRRGVKSKIEKGWKVGIAPVGYLNYRGFDGTCTIIKDPERFSIVRKMWNLALKGMSPQKIVDIANTEWGLRTRRTKSRLPRPYSRSAAYQLFSNIFYAGKFEYKGTLYQGRHKPMVSMEEFQQVQKFLGKTDRPRYQKHRFPYTGIIKCGCGCGNSVTAEEKTKTYVTTGKTQSFIYYRSTRRKKGTSCTERPISERELTKQILSTLDKLAIRQKFLPYAFDYLDDNQDQMLSDSLNIQANQLKVIGDKESELSKLKEMLRKGFVSDEEFVKERANLERDIELLKSKIEQVEKMD